MCKNIWGFTPLFFTAMVSSEREAREMEYISLSVEKTWPEVSFTRARAEWAAHGFLNKRALRKRRANKKPPFGGSLYNIAPCF